MPVLYILAGSNGAGKTSYYFTAVSKVFIDATLPFINVDLIAKDELGGYTAENFVKADLIYRERTGKLIHSKSDFMIESNLAKSSDYEWIDKMMQIGYDAVLYFLWTDDVNININRVQRRLKEGGHDIPPAIVIHRYKTGITYLKGKLHLFKEVHLIDNSSDEAIEVAQVTDSKLTQLVPALPQWANSVLYIVKRLQ